MSQSRSNAAALRVYWGALHGGFLRRMTMRRYKTTNYSLLILHLFLPPMAGPPIIPDSHPYHRTPFQSIHAIEPQRCCGSTGLLGAMPAECLPLACPWGLA